MQPCNVFVFDAYNKFVFIYRNKGNKWVEKLLGGKKPC